jgi:alpha-N-arabinofuranosidase
MSNRSAIILLAAAIGAAQAATYTVSPGGSDSNSGAAGLPFKTIQKAADVLQPGDTAILRGGTYRESVKPPRGGTGENTRITYKAYPGEVPIIKGSEPVKTWVAQSGGVWKADLPDAFFGAKNPFTINLAGDYLMSGQVNHLGDVYLNDEKYKEVFLLANVQSTPKTWFTSHAGTTTTIHANFGVADPNAQSAEVNVRASLFDGAQGINYITVDGLTIEQAATQWNANTPVQTGALATYSSKGWIVQNSHIYHSKCGCVALPARGEQMTAGTYGYHIIRNNLIEKCGEAGISSYAGTYAGLIEGNVIQDINYQNSMGGQEQGGIKTHLAIDLTIRNNIIRRVYNGTLDRRNDICAPGIWLDWSCQGVRITGNVIYDIIQSGTGNAGAWTINIEASHGPILVDNNVILGANVQSNSERTILAHNLFINSGFSVQGNDVRTPQWWKPHSGHTKVGNGMDKMIGDRYYSNIFAGKGMSSGEKGQDYKGGYNVFYQGAAMQPYKNIISPAIDSGSVENATFNPGFTHTDSPLGVSMRFSANATPSTIKSRLITKDFIGSYSVVNQGIENHDGSGIVIDKDMMGRSRNAARPMPGPFENISADSANVYSITAGPAASGTTGLGKARAGTRPSARPFLRSNRMSAGKIEVDEGYFRESFDVDGASNGRLRHIGQP